MAEMSTFKKIKSPVNEQEKSKMSKKMEIMKAHVDELFDGGKFIFAAINDAGAETGIATYIGGSAADQSILLCAIDDNMVDTHGRSSQELIDMFKEFLENDEKDNE